MPGFLIDLDGTLYNGKQPIPAACGFIDFLRRRKLPFLLLTNNSSRTPAEVADHLRAITGIAVEPEEIFTSAQAAARYIAGRQQRSLVYCIGEGGLEQALAEAGLQVIASGGPADEPDSAERMRRQLDRFGTPQFVVQGIDRQFSYAKLRLALQFINAGAVSVNTNPDLILPLDSGPAPGAGSIAASIEAAGQVKPVVIGKPSPIIMNYAIELMGLPARDIWMIGDNLKTDILGGQAAGCRTALVLTGLATAENVQRQIADSGARPDLICADLNEFIAQIER